jgi:DNA-directed RNA polymerase subunit M/transcription elongation factor TFIIS
MVSKNRKCPECGCDYGTKLIKVWVLKLRYCPTCDIPMFADNQKKILTCKKCGYEVEFNDKNATARMRVEMYGTTLDGKEALRFGAKGIQIDKQLVAKNRICKNCKNTRNAIQNNIPKLYSDQMKKLDDVEAMEYFRRYIQPKLREELEMQKAAIEKRTMLDNGRKVPRPKTPIIMSPRTVTKNKSDKP